MLEQICDNLIKGKAKEVKDLVGKAIKENINPADLVVAEVAKDLRDCIAMSRAAILSGTAVRKLRAWIAAQNRDPERGLKQLSKALNLAGVSIN